MAGNKKAKALLSQAAERGESALQVYQAVEDSFDGLDRLSRAWCLGYLSQLVGKPEGANPHDPGAGTQAAQLHERWADGWACGEGGDFEQLQERAMAFRGAQLA